MAISKSRGMTTDHPGAVVDWQSQTGSDIDQHFAMHHAGLDRWHSRNEPAFDPIVAERIRQIA